MDHTTCPNCHTLLDDPYLIMCPKCRTILSTHEPSQQIEQALLTQQKEAFAKELEKRVLKRLWKWIVLFFSLLSAVLGIGLWQIYTNLTSIVTNRIAKQFEEPRIKATLTEVAKTRASEIIESEVRAPIEQVKQSTAEAIESITESLQEAQSQVERMAQEGVFRPLDGVLYQKMVSSLQQVRSKYGDSTPSIRIAFYTGMKNRAGSLLISQLNFILKSSGFNISSVSDVTGMGLSYFHIELTYNPELENFAQDIIQPLSLLYDKESTKYGHSKNERMKKDVFNIGLRSKPSFNPNGTVFFR